MSHRGSIFFRVVGAIILIGVLAGAGAFIFQAGQAQGYALGSSASGAALQPPAPALPQGAPFYPGYSYPFWRPHFFFFPFGLIFGLFFLFVISGLFRRIFWGFPGPRGYWHGGYPGPRGWYPGYPGPNPSEPPAGDKPQQPQDQQS
jgi:hypothetical protein